MTGPEAEHRDLTDLDADQIKALIDDLGTDESRFAMIEAALQERAVSKATACALASAITGGPPTMWKTKRAALEAIRTKFEERVYQASKLSGLDKATPW